MDDWRQELSDFFQSREKQKHDAQTKAERARARVADFYSSSVIPAFEELKSELEKHRRRVATKVDKEEVSILVRFGSKELYYYRIKVKRHQDIVQPYADILFMDADGQKHVSTSPLGVSAQPCDVTDISKETIIRHFIADYKSKLSEQD